MAVTYDCIPNLAYMMSGVTRRRKIEVEGGPTSPTEEITENDKDLVQKSISNQLKAPKLTLLEEVYLMGLKDTQSLRGCILMELALRGKINVTKESKRKALPDRIVSVLDDKNMGETLLDEALKVIKTDTQSVGNWIDLLSGETWNLLKIGYQMKQVRERIAKGLVDKGVLRTEKKNFVLFDMATHPLSDSVIKTSIMRKVTDLLLGRGPSPDLRSICLVCAALAANVLENALASLPFEQREVAFQKAESFVSTFAQLNDKTRELGSNDVIAAVILFIEVLLKGFHNLFKNGQHLTFPPIS